VFTEPQFEPRLIATLTEGTAARVGVLDPLGVGSRPGADAYFELMTRLATSLRDCLLAAR
jgi:zinc transport system substrate-binding protein